MVGFGYILKLPSNLLLCHSFKPLYMTHLTIKLRDKIYQAEVLPAHSDDQSTCILFESKESRGMVIIPIAEAKLEVGDCMPYLRILELKRDKIVMPPYDEAN